MGGHVRKGECPQLQVCIYTMHLHSFQILAKLRLPKSLPAFEYPGHLWHQLCHKRKHSSAVNDPYLLAQMEMCIHQTRNTRAHMHEKI